MITSIHQPNFVPWIGYFYKIIKSDVFVMLDDVQYTKNSFINRNRIKTPNGIQWLTMPVKKSGHFGQSIKDVEIDAKEKSFKKILGTITANYKKSEYFSEVFPIIESSLNNNLLLDINETLIKKICNYLNISTAIIKSSEIDVTNIESTDRLIHICKELNATTYLAGFGSEKYQENEKFIKSGIETITYDFVHPVYLQAWGDFIPNLSIIDALFNCGKNTINFLKSKNC